jgi:transcriptional regulator with XRE-family HTH domain|tara:strand:+ start:423 stop:806 length:384 start_codon:yes stop_codon:yes gene_type:complete
VVHRKILCINIMRYLALRGLKKSDLATKAGVSISYISDVTNAKGNPSLDTMVAIADALDVPLVALLQPPPVGTDGWDASLADSVLKDDCKLGLPPGYRRVSAIVNEHQAFQIAKWHKAAHDRLKIKQ